MNSITLNQQLEALHAPLLMPNTNIPADNLQHNQLSLKSYALVLNQCLITKDRSMIQQILTQRAINNQDIIIENTVRSIAVDKLSVFLEIIEILMLEDSTNSGQKYSLWLAAILKLHMGYILNSLECRNKLAKLRKIIQKRINNQSALMKLNSSIKYRSERSNSIKPQYKPKFHYIEQEHEIKQFEEIDQEFPNEGEQQFDADQMDYFDDMDDLM